METYLRDLMLALTKTNVISHALVHDHEKHALARTSWLQTPAGKAKVVRASRWMTLGFVPVSPGFPYLLMRLIKQTKPAVLHLHLPNASAFWALVVPAARGLPWVLHWHSDVPDDIFSSSRWLRLLEKPYRLLEIAILSRAANVIVTSPPYLESSRAINQYKYKCSVVPLGIQPPVEVNAHSAVAFGRATEGRKLRVLAIGRLSYYKGFDLLIEALRHVQCAELRLVGDGDRKDALNRLTDVHGLDDRVTLMGSLSDSELESSWEWCDCVCLPSIERSEAFGVVLLEAMARGKACLAADVEGSGMGWLVDNGITGFTFEPQSVSSLTRALVCAGQNLQALDEMGRAGQRKFHEELDIDRSSRLVRGIYDRAGNHG
ncbi:MAG: glycosyltransferase [Halieaceae bacterium]|jgi:rhamnosyl/mannosyltransferase|nr:glycosyltransferase [Halieaceae bacterium]